MFCRTKDITIDSIVIQWYVNKWPGILKFSPRGATIFTDSVKRLKNDVDVLSNLRERLEQLQNTQPLWSTSFTFIRMFCRTKDITIDKSIQWIMWRDRPKQISLVCSSSLCSKRSLKLLKTSTSFLSRLTESVNIVAPQNTRPLIYIPLNNNRIHCYILRSTKHSDKCKWGGPKWPGILKLLPGYSEVTPIVFFSIELVILLDSMFSQIAPS